MAGSDGIAPDPVAALEPLRREPQRFSLFAALRLLERAEPARPRLGEARRPADETVLLEQPPHLEFAPGDIAATGVHRGKLRIEQLAFGMFGPNGALPFHLTEYAFERRRHHDDAAVSDFVNLFQHRFIALFYRAWAESDPVASHARAGDDAFTTHLGALIGLFGPAAVGRDAAPDYAKLCRASAFAPAARSAEGLQSILCDYFGLPIKIRPFIGEWLPIPPQARTRLGARDASAVIGAAATLGAASWQRQNRFEVAVGPLPFETFLRFLPGSRALEEMTALIRFYTTDEWGWQVRLLVAERDVPGATLGGIGRLGWTSWLGGKAGVASDVVLQGGRAAA